MERLFFSVERHICSYGVKCQFMLSSAVNAVFAVFNYDVDTTKPYKINGG